MKARVKKLAAATAVAVMAVGLAFGPAGTTAAHAITCLETLEMGSAGCRRAKAIQVSIDEHGTPRAGYMAGRFFVGMLPE